MNLDSFKACDIRSRFPYELNEDLVFRIGYATSQLLQLGSVVAGHDVRLSNPALQPALTAGINATGRPVIDIRRCGTEEADFQTKHLQDAGGIMVAASHNPIDYNCLKLVREEAHPINGDSGLFTVRNIVADIRIPPSATSVSNTQPSSIGCNVENRGKGVVIDQPAPYLPFEFIPIQHEPDGSLPNGIPNQLLPEAHAIAAEAVRAHRADLGIAWDGAFDHRCFFDADGRFIKGYYMVSLLAKALPTKHPEGKIIHHPRLIWNTIEMVREAGGIPMQSKTEHARQENALYGGDMSANHYFRDFPYCDSGMIPWLLIASLTSHTGQSLADMVADRRQAVSCSDEINFRVADASSVLQHMLKHFSKHSPVMDQTDGISANFRQGRFNLRSSNTEALL
jgi:phosphomannomutase / phosphoglucomutase